MTTNRHEDADPAWSPDSRLVAFDSKRSCRSQVYLVRAGGGRPQRLSHGRFQNAEPEFSPDGQTVLFTSYRNRDPLLRGIGNAEIMAADLRSRRVRNLTRSPAWEGDATWSPDGRWIAYAIRSDFGPSGTFRLAIVNRRGGRRRLLPAPRSRRGQPSNACCPAWAPLR